MVNCRISKPNVHLDISIMIKQKLNKINNYTSLKNLSCCTQ